MAIRLIIDIENQVIILERTDRQSRFQGQWVEFYALLALRRTNVVERKRFTGADEIARCASWRNKKLRSVRAVVARHLQRLEALGEGDILENQGRTKAWRLTLEPDYIEFIPSRGTVERWFETMSWSASVDAETIRDLRALVDASIMFERGEVEEAFEMVVDYRLDQKTRHRRRLDAWRDVLTARIAQRADLLDLDLLEPLWERWKSCIDPEGRAVYSRLLALEYFDQRFEKPDLALHRLEDLAARLQARGDLASLAPVWNVTGLLARRTKNPALGAEYHLRAAAMFGLLGDLHSLQAAIFNLALCRVDELKRQGRSPDTLVFDLVDTCLSICSQFNLGADSAQAEIAGCRWAVKAGDLRRARMYLNAAEGLLKKLPSLFDQACFLLARGELDALEPGRPGANPLRDVKTACRLFASIGDQYMVNKLQNKLEKLSCKD